MAPIPVPLEQLLAQEHYVRALARALVSDPHLADDVAQEAWLVALRRAPESIGSVRGWLAGVVRRVASQSRRADRRRSAREGGATPPESAPSTAEILAREDARRAAVVATVELPEPYRTALVLRFLEDLEPREIADRLQLPLETVRTQIKRGLALVRARLDRQYGGDRAAWCAALAPLAGLGSGAVAFPIATGALVMSKSQIAIASLLLLTLGIWALWGLDGSITAPTDGGGREPLSPVAIATQQNGEAPATAPQSGVRSEAPAKSDLPPRFAAAMARAHGRVVEFDGRPVGGARVDLIGLLGDVLAADVASLLEPSAPWLEQVAAESATTDAAGKFTLSSVDPRELHLIQIRLRSGPGLLQMLEHSPSPSSDVDLGDFVIPPLRTIRGRVVDGDRQPLAGARVRINGLPQEILRGGLALLEPDSVGLMEPNSPRARFVDAPPWLGPLLARLPRPEATSAADGTFVISHLPEGPWTLEAKLAHRPLTLLGPIPVQRESELSVGDVVLERGAELRGRAVDEGGRPVEGVELAAFAPLPSGLPCAVSVARARSGSDGTFRLDGLPQRALPVAWRLRGEEWRSATEPGVDGEDVKITLHALQSLEVRVADSEGKPVNAQIEMLSAAEPLLTVLPGLLHHRPIACSVLAAGRFELSGLRPGTASFLVRSEGFVPSMVATKIDPGVRPEPISVVLDRAFPVEVAVSDGSGATLEGATVLAFSNRTFSRSGRFSSGSAKSDRQGLARVTATGASTIVLVSHPEFASFSVDVPLPARDRVAAILTKGGAVEGEIVGLSPGEFRKVIITPRRRTMAAPRILLSDRAGRFRCTHLAPGSYSIQISGAAPGQNAGSALEDLLDGQPGLASARFEISEGQTASVTLTLPKPDPPQAAGGGSITGVVRKNGRPLPGASIQILVGDGGSVQTDAQGRFTLGPLSSGDRWVTIFAEKIGSWDQLASRSVSVRDGETSQVEFDIETLGPVVGKVISKRTGAPIADARLTGFTRASEENTLHLNATADRGGWFTFPEVGLGTLNIFASAKGFCDGKASAFEVRRGADPPIVTIELEDGLRRRGRALRASGERGGWKELVWSREEYQLVDRSRLCSIDPETGQFEMVDLSPGKYRVAPIVSTTTANPDGTTTSYTGSDPAVKPLILEIGAAGSTELDLLFGPAAQK